MGASLSNASSTARYGNPTEEEVMAAVRRYSLYRNDVQDRPSYRPQGKADVAEAIAEARGHRIDSSLYVSRASAVGKVVSIQRVKAILEDLTARGKIVAIPGDHWSLSGKNGFVTRGRYYLTPEAMQFVCDQFDERSKANRAATARKEAEQFILDKYADEVEQKYQLRLVVHEGKFVSSRVKW